MTPYVLVGEAVCEHDDEQEFAPFDEFDLLGTFTENCPVASPPLHGLPTDSISPVRPGPHTKGLEFLPQ